MSPKRTKHRSWGHYGLSFEYSNWEVISLSWRKVILWVILYLNSILLQKMLMLEIKLLIIKNESIVSKYAYLIKRKIYILFLLLCSGNSDCGRHYRDNPMSRSASQIEIAVYIILYLGQHFEWKIFHLYQQIGNHKPLRSLLK